MSHAPSTRPPYFIDVRDSSHVGAARRAAIAYAYDCGFGEATAARIGIISTELTTNLVRHAVEGTLVVQWLDDGHEAVLELLSVDRGPGMLDVARCMRDGYTTAGTPGTGLGAVKRLADDFDIYSLPQKGTVVICRTHLTPRRPHKVEWGIYCRAMLGESVCGDGWRAAVERTRASFMVVDGLGHGALAAEAAHRAVDAFSASPHSAPVAILEQIHKRMAGSRGGVVAAASLDINAGRLAYAGVGNISGSLHHNGSSKGLVSHNGTIGVQVRKFQAFDFDWQANGILVMHSDGLKSRWSLAEYPGIGHSHPAIIAATLARDFDRGRDDVTVLVARLGA